MRGRDAKVSVGGRPITPMRHSFEVCSCEEALELRRVLAALLADAPGAREEAREVLGAVEDSAGPAEDAAFAQVMADAPEPPAELEQPTNEDPELVCTEAGPCKFHADNLELLMTEKCPGFCPVGGIEGCRDAIGCEEAGMCDAHASKWHAEQAGIGGAP